MSTSQTAQLQATSPVLSSGSFCSHDFKEEYYGWRCAKCSQFYPNTAALESWLLGEPFSKKDCPHLEIQETEDCIKCRYCGEVLLP